MNLSQGTTHHVFTPATLMSTASGLSAHRVGCDHEGVTLGVATPPANGEGMYLAVADITCLEVNP